MKNVFVAVAATLAIVAALLSSSLTAGQQSRQRFQYLQVEHFAEYSQSGPGTTGYRACVAEVSDWSCRNFERPSVTSRFPATGVALQPPADPALREVLATLGNEGWELVSTVDDTPDRDTGMAYVFKRPF